MCVIIASRALAGLIKKSHTHATSWKTCYVNTVDRIIDIYCETIFQQIESLRKRVWWTRDNGFAVNFAKIFFRGMTVFALLRSL